MKRILCLILVMVLVLVASACGGDPSTNKVESADTFEDSAEASDIVTSEEAESEEESSREDERSSRPQSNRSSRPSYNNTSRRPIQYRPEQNQNSSRVVNSNGNRSSSDYGNSSRYNSSRPMYSNTTSAQRTPKMRDTLIRRLNQQYFKTVGRCVTNAVIGLDLNWSCSSVEFDMECMDEIILYFTRGSGNNPVFVEIYVDGKIIEPRTKFSLAGNIEMTIAQNLEYGVHRIKIVRQSDCECPTLTLSKIRTRGSLVEQAPKNSNLYIECIGDATLIGWGVGLEDSFFKDFTPSEHQSTARNKEYQDATLAYPYVAAEKLGADTYVLAKQGAGIAATWHRKNLDGQYIAVPRSGLLPTMYEYNSPYGSYKYEQTRTPDVIVIDAGSADINSTCLSAVGDNGKLGIDVNRATEISKDFLTSLKAKNPKVKIIWCYGLSGSSDSLVKYIEGIVKDLGGSSKGFYTLSLPANQRSGYPSAKEHEAAANILVNKIKQITK